MRLFAMGAALLAVLAGAAGCASTEESAPSPAPTASASSPTPKATTLPKTTLPKTTLGTGTAGSDGLTVRYRDDDGSLKTVRVEDFPR